jgi:molecular chaperone GrpE
VTEDQAASILQEFHRWLTELSTLPAPPPEPPQVGLQNIVAQMTALRHDVQLSIKANRSLVEQFSSKPEESSPEMRDAIDALIGIADALVLSLRQIEKARNALAESQSEPIASLPDRPAEPPRRGWFSSTPSPWLAWAESVEAAWNAQHEQRESEREHRDQWLNSIADGYTLSLRRVDRLWDKFGVTALPTEGERFDPESMEAVELIDSDGVASGSVVSEVRRGYRWRGKLLRAAQVRVAR